MLACIGRMNELEQLFAKRGERKLIGPGAVVADHAHDGLSVMKNQPGVAFKFGPMAVASLRTALGMPDPLHQTLLDAQSTTAGFSL